MIRFSLAPGAVLLLVLPVAAQPEMAPAKRPAAVVRAPQINPEARALVETMIALYQKLPSYSDATRVELLGGAALPQELRAAFPVEAKLAWNRPANLRFEGTAGGKAFLALSDKTTVRALNPAHPTMVLERPQNPPLVATFPDGHTETMPAPQTPPRLEAAVFESGALSFGLAFMTEPQFWTRTLKDVTVLALETDAEIGGEMCRVVNVQAEGDGGNSALIRLWIAKSDGLLRRLEQSDAQMGANSKIIETHFDVKAGAELPASTWEFAAPQGRKKVDNFPSRFQRFEGLAVKIGDALPTFSGDDLNGQPLELNAKDGKVTLLYFFTMSAGQPNAQMLQRLQTALGPKGLRVVGVSGDARRERVEKFALDNHLTFPIFFEEAGMQNRLAMLLGVRGWSTTLIFNRQGKLQTITGVPGEVEWTDGMKKLFPGEKIEDLMFDMAALNAPEAEIMPATTP